MKIILIVVAVLTLLLFGWLGLRVKPRPLPAFAGNSPVLETVPLPEGLPAPVERFYRQLYGDRVPVIESAVISGRAVMSPVGGVKIPARFRFYHRAGQDYRHFFEMTWFGRKFRHGQRVLPGRQEPADPAHGSQRRRATDRPGRQPQHVGRVRLAAGRADHRPARPLGAGGREHGAVDRALRRRRADLRRPLRSRQRPAADARIDAL